MLYSLFVTCGNDYGKSFVLNEQTVTIGRDQNSSVLLEDEEVSRLHCTLSAESSKVFLVDEESSNGTFLNGLAIAAPKSAKATRFGSAIPNWSSTVSYRFRLIKRTFHH